MWRWTQLEKFIPNKELDELGEGLIRSYLKKSGITLLAALLGMWQNATIFVAVILIIFLVVLAGTVLDVLLEEIRHQFGMLIVT